MRNFDLSTEDDAKRKGWNPDPRFHKFLKMAVLNIKETTRLGEPIYNDSWLDANQDLILEAFSYGYSTKTIAGLLGVPWHVWLRWSQLHSRFEQFLSMAESIQLMGFEQMRNEQSRGELRGSASSTLAVIDRLHSDQYFGRPGQNTKTGGESSDAEMTLEEAEAILEEAGISEYTDADPG